MKTLYQKVVGLSDQDKIYHVATTSILSGIHLNSFHLC